MPPALYIVYRIRKSEDHVIYGLGACPADTHIHDWATKMGGRAVYFSRVEENALEFYSDRVASAVQHSILATKMQ